MPLALFNRRRKVSSVEPHEMETIPLRVLVDSGPAARDMFVIHVSANGDANAIRAAVAAEIDIPSMCLFKVAIPWQAHYEARAYDTQWGATPSLLSVFPGWNLDDSSQLAASGGANPPAYIPGSDSLRGRRRHSQGVVATVRDWFPCLAHEDGNINVLVRTAASSSLDWARPVASTPITLSARFTQDRRRRPGLPSLGAAPLRCAADTTLVDISPEASVDELKVSLLLAAGRPAPAGLLDAVVLWRVDVSEPELEAIESTGGLSRGRRPSPYPPHAAPPLHLDDPNARVADYFPNFRSSRGDPRRVTLSVWINPAIADALAPRNPVPRFHYPMPSVRPPPTRHVTRPLPSLSFDSPISPYSEAPVARSGSSNVLPALAMHRCCSSGHESGSTGGLIGLGIIMSPTPSVSDHGSSDDEAFSWPPTPVVGGDEVAWIAGPSPTAPAWGHEGEEQLLDHDLEQAATPKGLYQSFSIASPPSSQPASSSSRT